MKRGAELMEEERDESNPKRVKQDLLARFDISESAAGNSCAIRVLWELTLEDPILAFLIETKLQGERMRKLRVPRGI